MTTTSGPRPPGPALPPPPDGGREEMGEGEAARVMEVLTRPAADLGGPAGAFLQLAVAASMTVAGAEVLLIAVPCVRTQAAGWGCLAVIAAWALVPAAGRVAAARGPEPGWVRAAAVLERAHPGVLPAATLAAARRWIPAMAAARGQPRAWLYVAPCAGRCTRLCRAAAVVPASGRLLVILGAHTAADPRAAAVSLAHEAGHVTGWTRRALAVISGARAGGLGWAAAGAAGFAAGRWPGAAAAAVIFQVSSMLVGWAVEIACDRRAVRAEGRAAARRAWDYMHAARAAGRPRGRARRVLLAALDWAAGPSHPPLALRRAAARHPAPGLILLAAAVLVAGAGVWLALPAAHGQPQAAAATAPAAPPRLAACARAAQVPCWAQDPLHEAYGTGALYQRGITGAGTTIAVIMPDAGAGAARDLAVFSARYRLPPARLKVLTWHRARAGSPRDPNVAGWEEEGAADLEMAHFMAPGARLAYVRIPQAPGRYLTGTERDAMDALAWLAARQRVDVASFSWGLYEADLARSGGYGQLAGARAGLVSAVAAGVSVIAGSGDSGPAGPDGAGGVYPSPTVPWPTSDPLVTGVGATRLDITAHGTLAAPETVGRAPGGFAGGGGLSAVFPRPAYQDGVAPVTGSRRGVVDVSMDAFAWAYLKVPGLPGSPGWHDVKGTSISAPLLAGLAADAAQLAGHPLGPVNPALYRMRGPADGILDITRGTNTDYGVAGYPAGPGYDLPTGIGTVGNAALFVPALARLAQQPPGQQ